jgi:uncharacterized protein (TIGR00255 family)
MSQTGAVQSMTGFAGVEREAGGVRFAIEARSVNGRSLDVRLRVPTGHERHEAELRRRIGAAFRRGSVSLALTVRRAESAARYTVNREQLAAYLDAIQAMAASGSVAAPRADGLLALRGVVETAGDEDALVPDAALLAAADAVIAALEENRLAEGARLVPVIAAQLDEMERIRAAVDAHPERALPAIRDRIARQIDELLPKEGLSQERLHQEAALIATRADVREELDRLAAHVAAARALLAEGGAIGRKLDFLAQEFNRETNTICAKAPHHAVTALGLELKAVVERFREQVQNLE